MFSCYKILLILCLFYQALADVVIQAVEAYYAYGLAPSFESAEDFNVPTAATSTHHGTQCSFPYDSGLVPITPHMANGGWAMSPHQQCSCHSWCPYACPAGFQSGQWDPSLGAGRMNGGFFCNAQGTLEAPRPAELLCRDLRGEISIRNVGRSETHACQTVFPGNEDVLIPNTLPVNQPVQIAIPDQASYQAPGTSEAAGAHFYINPHGIPRETACSWGSKDRGPYGNWAPFVVGTNRGPDGTVYVALSWNPVYLEWETPFRAQRPNYGLRMGCEEGGCRNAECAIDPSVHGVNQIAGNGDASGPGYAKGPAQAFCVTAVPRGCRAEILLFEV